MMLRMRLLSGGSGVVPPEKGGSMFGAITALAIALLISALVIDRLTR
jgi:hypothetical protein